MATISEALVVAMRYHQSGNLQQAEAIYRQILQVDPSNADALHLLGVIAAQVGKHDLAVEYISQAIRLRPSEPTFHNNLGNVFKGQGQLAAAVGQYQEAVRLKPDYADAYNNLGVAFRDQGQLAAAVGQYQEAVRLKPDYADAHYNLGNAFKDQGRLAAAVGQYQEALRLKSDYADAHLNLGNALQAQGRLAAAVAQYQEALRLKPDYVEAYNNLGKALKEQGQLAEAVRQYQTALRLNPDFIDAHLDLGNALLDQGQLAAAVAQYQQAIRLKPDLAGAYTNLGNALREQGQLAEAVTQHQEALRLKPDYVEAYNNLGNALREQGQLTAAVVQYQQALRLKPDYADAYNNLGVALNEQGQLAAAVVQYQEVIRLKPDYAEAHNNLGNALKDQGELNEAVACFRRTLELKPDYVGAHSNLVYTLTFCPGYDAQTLYEEHRQWNQRHAAPLVKSIQSHRNDRSPDRRLRIGYVSPDFRSHPVGRFLLPLLTAHDHGSFEIFCYASVRIPDTITDRCRAQADGWRHVLGLSDEQVAEAIRQNHIDILVDLTMHMADNRLLVFARKPAPVQVTYLAYCGTTGLNTIDYRLTDPYQDPPGRFDQFYSEQSIHLPKTLACYQPIGQTPCANRLPALKAGYVTFGSLNNFCKVTAATLAAWRKLLQEVPQSRLLLHSQVGKHRDQVSSFFAEQDISPDRLMFVGKVPMAEYFGIYERLDVALDPFPYGGGTTTCDALWMGVPVVSLAGQTAVGRGGVSILSNVGLPELVADDAKQYVDIAVELAQDLSRLSELRASLRDRMQASPLMDAPRFARNVEAAYREMWRRWCVNSTAHHRASVLPG